WVDPSAPVPNVLGQGVMGRRGLVLDGGPGRFLQAPVAQPQANREEVQGVARLDPDGALEASLKIREYGANALAWLGLAGTAPRDQRQVFQLYVSGINPTGVLRDFFLQSPPPSAPGAPMEITVNFETAQGVGKERNGESYKMPLPMLKQRRLISYAETPVGQRLYPVELGANAYEERRLQIVLPEGWTVKSLPGAVTLNNAVGSFQVDVRAQDRTISYFSRVIVRRPEVPLKDYADFKALMDQLNTSSEESITLNPPAAATPSPSPSPSP
ncbi:MAG: DUF3858 domain-containing protein, partial [Armatimonadetes bacterium]|nr:DUF3858 domain-containing protein [Armatimonadota bacterium]